MGQVTLTPEETKQTGQESFPISLNLRRFRPKLMTLMHHNLPALRDKYDNFRRECGSTNYKKISLRAFQEVSPLKVILSKVVFDEFGRGKDQINFYEIFFVMVLTSYATLQQPTSFIMSLISGSEEGMTPTQFEFMFIRICKALEKMHISSLNDQ